VKRVVLAGAGHAHLVVLRAIAAQPLYGASVTLVSPYPRQVYSGMLPGLIAGHHAVEDVLVDVAGLAGRVGAEFVQGAVDALDVTARQLRLHDGREVEYDYLSLNVGSLVSAGGLPGGELGLPVKPFEPFLGALDGEPFSRVAVVGAGAAGMELAMALAHRGAAVTLYADKPTLPAALIERAERRMRRIGVDYRVGMPVSALEPGPVVVTGAARQEFDHVILSTGLAPAPFLAASGLFCTERGYVRVAPTLRSLSHERVFAAGDCATVHETPHPKSGVYSVRHGEILAANLRAVVLGTELKAYQPQKKSLQILTCGSRYAIAQRAERVVEGWWVWRWKNWIDRRWMRSLRP
jgi:pyridine nucleotide-disulfide oxidoreductase family protein